MPETKFEKGNKAKFEPAEYDRAAEHSLPIRAMNKTSTYTIKDVADDGDLVLEGYARKTFKPYLFRKVQDGK
jgi:hypothetical protein